MISGREQGMIYFVTGKFRNDYIETENFSGTMVIFATLDTNIKKVVQDPVDKIHGIKHPRYPSDPIIVKDYGGRDHTLDPSTGRLWLGNVQDELPVVAAIVRYSSHGPDIFKPMLVPSKGEWYSFSTVFELERLASEPIVINGIIEINSDGGPSFPPEHSYVRSQKAELDEFVAKYARAVRSAHFGKPVLEGFYKTMKRSNGERLDDANQPCPNPDEAEKYERRRKALRNGVFREQDFEVAFGKALFDQLRGALGEPRVD